MYQLFMEDLSGRINQYDEEERHSLSDRDTLFRLGGGECIVTYGEKLDELELRRLAEEQKIQFVRIRTAGSIGGILLELEVDDLGGTPLVTIMQAISYAGSMEAVFYEDLLKRGNLFPLEQKIIKSVTDVECANIHAAIMDFLREMNFITSYRSIPADDVWGVVWESIDVDSDLGKCLEFEFLFLIDAYTDEEDCVSEKILKARKYFKDRLSRGKAMRSYKGTLYSPAGYALFINEEERRYFVGGAEEGNSIIDQVFDQIAWQMKV